MYNSGNHKTFSIKPVDRKTVRRFYPQCALALGALMLSSCSAVREVPTTTAAISPEIAPEIAPAPPQFVPPPIEEEHLVLPEYKPTFAIPLPPNPKSHASGHGKPVKFEKKKLNGVSFYLTTVDLADPDAYLAIGLANNAKTANCAGLSHGDEAFQSLVKRSHAAVVLNGTFFSKDDEKRVMGNMVSDGSFVKYSQWENYGTTLGLTRDNKLEMVTARKEGKPRWEQYWFSITCGPRLVEHGQVELDPEKEGFKDSHVLGIGPRVALGFPATCDKLYLVAFLSGLSLKEEAKMMRGIGCYEAMNLDGGASRALAHDGTIVIPAGRPLTNVISVYDSAHQPPQAMRNSFVAFEKGALPKPLAEEPPEVDLTAQGQ